MSIKIVSRGKGASAVAKATYRAGEKITNEYDGKIHDYTRKGGIAHTEILLPDNAPAEFADRAVLWNAVEKIEKADNSQLAREIEVTNQRLRQLKARIDKLHGWLKEEAANTEPPTLADVISGILSRREQAGKSHISQSLYNIKDASKMLNFLTANKIMDMAGLEEKVKSMYGRQADIRDKLKPIERRLKTLDEHIKQSDIYLTHKTVYKHYQQEKNPKHKEKYAEAHRTEVTLYEAADRYLKSVMNGHTTLPTKTWRAERDKLMAEQKTLNREYVSLKDEVKEVEQIRRNVYDMMRAEQREQQLRKDKGMEL